MAVIFPWTFFGHIFLDVFFATYICSVVWHCCSSSTSKHLSGAVGKAVANRAEVRGSIPSTDVGKEPDREIFAAVPDASVLRQTARNI